MHKEKTKNMEKGIHMEFDTDDDVEEQLKNANDRTAEGKVQVKTKWYAIMSFVVKMRVESKPT